MVRNSLYESIKGPIWNFEQCPVVLSQIISWSCESEISEKLLWPMCVQQNDKWTTNDSSMVSHKHPWETTELAICLSPMCGDIKEKRVKN